MELTTRNTSLTCAVSGLACMRTCQDSLCSCATEHGIIWMAFFFVNVSSISISPERGDSLFDQHGQRFVIYAHVPGFLVLLRHQGANLPQRKPVTADLMGVLHQSLELSNPDSVMLWAACWDPFRRGKDQFLGPWLCTPLSCLSADQLPSSLWTRCWASLHFSGWLSLSRTRLSSFLQATLQAAGIPGKFSGHSLRIGAATTATHRGIPDHLIKTMGRWWSEAYLLYVCTPVVTILSVTGRIS